ncbi:unnamed protein product [Penicillium olsonii]|nr:unnamed protein product [Penicillium olsonii]CAG7928497.1 unnamed protein product [Penicillium olsonii]
MATETPIESKQVPFESSFSQVSSHALGFYSASESATSSSWHGATTIDKDGFMTSAHRVGGPRLVSLPAVNSPCPDSRFPGSSSREAQTRLANRVLAVMKEMYLEFSSMQIVLRKHKSQSDWATAIPTVLLVMPMGSTLATIPETWYQAVRKIHRDLARHSQEMSVEIIEESLSTGIYLSLMPPKGSIVPKWTSIAYSIGKLAKPDWSGVECWRYGTNPDREENPITVIVKVHKASKDSFVKEAKQVHRVLEIFEEPDVDVLFQKNYETSFVQNPEVHPDSLLGGIYPGVSIGIQDSSAGSSTLGGLVELEMRQPDGTLSSEIFAMTCFHCVWPPGKHRNHPKFNSKEAQTALATMIHHPLRPDGARTAQNLLKKILQIEHPSTRDLKQTIEYAKDDIELLRGSIATYEQLPGVGSSASTGGRITSGLQVLREHVQSHQKTIDACTNALRSNHLGYVWAGSGMYRTITASSGQRYAVDWALIRPDSLRIRHQMIGGEFQGNKPFSYSKPSPSDPPFRHVPGLDPFAAPRYIKSGRSTGLSRLNLNVIEAVTYTGEFRTRQGHQVWETQLKFEKCGMADPSCEPGDSGAWICTAAGSVLGVVVSGDPTTGTMKIHLLDHIVDDILAVTGAHSLKFP